MVNYVTSLYLAVVGLIINLWIDYQCDLPKEQATEYGTYPSVIMPPRVL